MDTARLIPTTLSIGSNYPFRTEYNPLLVMPQNCVGGFLATHRTGMFITIVESDIAIHIKPRVLRPGI